MGTRGTQQKTPLCYKNEPINLTFTQMGYCKCNTKMMKQSKQLQGITFHTSCIFPLFCWIDEDMPQ